MIIILNQNQELGGWKLGSIFLILWMKMFYYSQKRFVLLKRTQNLKTKLVMETTGILGRQTSEKSWYSSLYVLYSFHVWGLEGRQVWHFRCKKRKLIYCRWHSVPKVPVMPAHCFQARKWFHNAKAQEGELSREPALHKIAKFLALATAW